MTSVLTSGLSKLNPFSKPKEDDDDKGEEVQADSVGGGGQASQKATVPKGRLRVSRALKAMLSDEGVISEKDAEGDPSQHSSALRQILETHHINVPQEVTDRSHPLSEYFISSSHNTYLQAHQLYGSAAADAYHTALSTGARCVEIDAWDNDDDKEEPKVTHGYTLASNIPFRAVCEAMKGVIDKEATEDLKRSGYHAGPIMLSLENHCSAHGQQRLVDIMKTVWGDRLLSQRVRRAGKEEQQGSDEQVTLEDLGSKIAVMVEYYFPDQPVDDDAEQDMDEAAEDEKMDRRDYEKKKKAAPKVGIIPELAELGVYAQSVKPRDQSWLESELKNGPHDHLINVSETGLLTLMPANNAKISRHNARHLMRVFPKGTRISSANLHPVPFWGVGAQVCALNWQTFGASAQLNEALFSGTDGYVLKPAPLRAGGSGTLSTGKKLKLRLRVEGATDVPVPETRREANAKDPIIPYLTCTLVHPSDLKNEPPKRKTAAYKPHKLGPRHKGTNPPPSNPVWNETLEWEYDDNDLTFLRMLIKSDDKYASNPVLAVAAVRLVFVLREQWVFVRMLDLRGRETGCSLLVKFEFEEV